MQIAGAMCKVCSQRIVFADEGKFCAQCGTCVHHVCDGAAVCEACGRPYQSQEPVVPDPAHDGILPRSLRTPHSYGPMFAICAILLVLLFVLLVVLAFGAGT